MPPPAHKCVFDWQPRDADVSDEDKRRLATQLVQLDEAYPGGLLQYVGNAKRLLQDSREGAGAPCCAGQFEAPTCRAAFSHDWHRTQ